MKVKIPAGIDTGKSIRARGQRKSGNQWRKSRDLLLKVKVASKPGYERKGMDVLHNIRVPFTTAVLGGRRRLRHFTEMYCVRLIRNSQSGTKIRLRGKGIVFYER